MLTDLRGNRLAVESDIRISDFPTVASCLNNIQLTPSEFNNGLQVVAENIDLWRASLDTRIKLYNLPSLTFRHLLMLLLTLVI